MDLERCIEVSIRILIADDHKIVRAGIKAELNTHSDFEIVGEATTGDMALEMALGLVPDILLLDVMMPGMKSREVIQRIHQEKLSTRIMILTAHGDRGTVFGMLRLQVNGFLLKDEDTDVLPDAIRKIASGQRWASPKVADYLMEFSQAPETKLERPVLSEKEIDILRLLSEGYTTKEMTVELNMKERTVEYHMKCINAKLGTSTRTQAVAWAKDYGIL